MKWVAAPLITKVKALPCLLLRLAPHNSPPELLLASTHTALWSSNIHAPLMPQPLLHDALMSAMIGRPWYGRSVEHCTPDSWAVSADYGPIPKNKVGDWRHRRNRSDTSPRQHTARCTAAAHSCHMPLAVTIGMRPSTPLPGSALLAARWHVTRCLSHFCVQIRDNLGKLENAGARSKVRQVSAAG